MAGHRLARGSTLRLAGERSARRVGRHLTQPPPPGFATFVALTNVAFGGTARLEQGVATVAVLWVGKYRDARSLPFGPAADANVILCTSPAWTTLVAVAIAAVRLVVFVLRRR
jgi:hypothetical protein